MPCRQSSCGSFIEIKEVREGREKEKYREKEEGGRSSLPLQKDSRELECGWSLSLKGIFATS